MAPLPAGSSHPPFGASCNSLRDLGLDLQCRPVVITGKDIPLARKTVRDADADSYIPLVLSRLEATNVMAVLDEVLCLPLLLSSHMESADEGGGRANLAPRSQPGLVSAKRNAATG